MVEEVEMVRVLEQVGLQGLLVGKVYVAPAGNPEANRVTPADVPDMYVLVTVLDPDEPAVTVILPELARV